MKTPVVFSFKTLVGFVSALVILCMVSCAKNYESPKVAATGPPTFSAKCGGYNRTFAINSVTYIDSVLTMNLQANGKPDSCKITLVISSRHYGNYTFAAKSSPNYAYMTIMDHKDTVYYTDNTHLGNVQITQFSDVSGNHLAEGNFTFTCNETSPTAGGGVDTATGSFIGITW